MKTFIATLFLLTLAMSFSVNAESEGHQMGGCLDGQMMGTMDQIANDPEMRHQMMQKMMESMNTDMHQMMNDPEMKARMQMHMEMMQAMMGPDGMDEAKMKEMMENPEMIGMLQMHMMSMQMMNEGMMGEHSKEDSEEHAH